MLYYNIGRSDLHTQHLWNAQCKQYIFYYYQRARRKMAVCWWLTTGGLFLMAWGLEANLAEGGIYIYAVN